MAYLSNIIFVIVLVTAIFFFRKITFVKRNIQMGKAIERKDHAQKRWSNMIRIAWDNLKWLPDLLLILHIVVYIDLFL